MYFIGNILTTNMWFGYINDLVSRVYELNDKRKKKIHDHVDSISFDEAIKLREAAIAEICKLKPSALSNTTTQGETYRLYRNLEIIASVNAKKST